ncbi:MAG: ATP-binding protein [Candidatus Saccharimonadales bacterium]
MSKTKLKRPVLIYLYGIPGSGKSLLSHNLSNELDMVVVSSDRLRYELFEDPRHDKTEIQIIGQLMNYMTEEFLKAGKSVIYDMSVSRFADRKELRELAKKNHAKDLMIWLQVDIETAWARSKNRDKRKAEDKYASVLSPDQFKQYVHIMQNPRNEDYVVVSGKHLFPNHKSIIVRKLLELGVAESDDAAYKVAKPELVNLVSKAQAQAGRVDYSRRNISIQ